MLERARAKVPGATFQQGRMQALPSSPSSVDLVVSGLALSHVEDLAPVYAEFAPGAPARRPRASRPTCTR